MKRFPVGNYDLGWNQFRTQVILACLDLVLQPISSCAAELVSKVLRIFQCKSTPSLLANRSTSRHSFDLVYLQHSVTTHRRFINSPVLMQDTKSLICFQFTWFSAVGFCAIHNQTGLNRHQKHSHREMEKQQSTPSHFAA